MGLFKRRAIEKAAGVKFSDPGSEYYRKLYVYLKSKKEKETLNENESKILSKIEKRQAHLDRTATRSREQLNITGKPHCPFCGSENVQLAGSARGGFSAGKAVGGALLTGGVGLLAGFAGKNKGVEFVCLDCGNQYIQLKPGVL